MGRDPEDLALVYLFPTILIAMYFGSSVAVMSSFALTGRPAVFGPLWKILLKPGRCGASARRGREALHARSFPTVLGAPGTLEIRLANENNAARGHHATVTDVDFSIGSVKPFWAGSR